MQGEIAGIRYFVGTMTFITDMTGLTLEATHLQRIQKRGHTLVLLANHQAILGAFILNDEIRAGARELIQALQQQGKSVSLLSGDHAFAVQRVAKAVGIETVHSNQMPEDKLRYIKALQKKRRNRSYGR
ncbi:hypothetical protein BGP_0535 [Beggiatoa sp. PS]|nr:hypothetical protein BGP_0535 [Beggiatoa sp. PS]